MKIIARPIYDWIHRNAPSGIKSNIYRLYRRLNPNDIQNQILPLTGNLAGHRMRFRKKEDRQFANPDYEPETCKVISQLLKPGWVCADVGGHIGYITLLMAKLVGEQGHIYAFEALPENARLLKKNMALNHYSKRLTVENLAVSDGSQAKVALYSGPSSFESTIMSRGWEPLLEVPGVALDDYFGSKSRLDFIKMDIEGAELVAIPGMHRVLQVLQPILLIEVHDIAQPVLKDLEKLGCHFYDLNLQPLAMDKPEDFGLNHYVVTTKMLT